MATLVPPYRAEGLQMMLRDAGMEPGDIPDEVADDAMRAMMQNDPDVAYNLIATWIGQRNERLEKDRSRARRIREDQQSFRHARRGRRRLAAAWGRHAR